MSGLIKKDLLIIKANIKTILIIAFIFVFNSSKMLFMLPFLCVLFLITTFSYDDFNNWHAYAITFPSGRKSIVKSKYILTIIIIIFSTLVTGFITTIIDHTKGNFDFDQTLSSLFGCILAISIIVSIMYPLIFKFGVEKGRIILFVIIFSISLMGSFLISSNVLLTFLQNIDKYAIILLPVITISLLLISYFISLKVYLKKEF